MRPARPDHEADLHFVVEGEPKTAGSKTSGVATKWDPVQKKRVPVKKDGRFVTFTKDSSGAEGESWRTAVANAAREARDAADLTVFVDVPLVVEMVFWRPRKPSHYSKRDGSLLPSAPLYPATRPDVLKLARAVEDACSSVIWNDDARIVGGHNDKAFCPPEEPQRLEVWVWRLTATEGERLASVQPLLAH